LKKLNFITKNFKRKESQCNARPFLHIILREYPEMGENIGENSGILKNPEIESAVIFRGNKKLH
jgi:hypothetical protein